MNPVTNRNPDWLFAEPAGRARRRAAMLKAACGVSIVVVLTTLVFAFRGSIPGVLTVFVATFMATVTGVEAYWAGEIARRAEETERRLAAPTRSVESANDDRRSDELGPEREGRAALADGTRAAKVLAP